MHELLSRNESRRALTVLLVGGQKPIDVNNHARLSQEWVLHVLPFPGGGGKRKHINKTPRNLRKTLGQSWEKVVYVFSSLLLFHVTAPEWCFRLSLKASFAIGRKPVLGLRAQNTVKSHPKMDLATQEK